MTEREPVLHHSGGVWEDCPDCQGEPMNQYLPTGEMGCAACSNRGGFVIPASAFHAAPDETEAD